jgi:hypothetical protein
VPALWARVSPLKLFGTPAASAVRQNEPRAKGAGGGQLKSWRFRSPFWRVRLASIFRLSSRLSLGVQAKLIRPPMLRSRGVSCLVLISFRKPSEPL